MAVDAENNIRFLSALYRKDIFVDEAKGLTYTENISESFLQQTREHFAFTGYQLCSPTFSFIHLSCKDSR